MFTGEFAPQSAWRPITKVAFRFFGLYFFLYVAMTQMLSALILLPVGSLPDLSAFMHRVVAWTGDRVFHVTVKPALSGSGDKLYDWVQVFCLLVIAAAGCALWSAIERRAYDRIYRWFRVFVRFSLGSTLISYGFVKVFPLQMPAPQLTRLLEPYGNFSPMGVLWYSIGASFPYERLVGLAEVIGGGLLFFPRTQLAGALICLCTTVQVFVLNMTYDVPVKLFSFHLVLMSAVLIAPYAKQICGVVFGAPSRFRWASAAQMVFGLYLLSMTSYGASKAWATRGPNAPKPPLYGIWTIDTMVIDGVERLPLVTDYERWRRVIVRDATTIAFWRMDDTFMSLGATVNMGAKTITLARGTDAAGSFRFEQPSPGLLILDGTIDKHTLLMKTKLVDHTKFQLLSRGFRWVQEVPFNR
jgi:hypothetical protein